MFPVISLYLKVALECKLSLTSYIMGTTIVFENY